MRILVTGFAGYLGQVLVHTLQEAGYECIGVDTFRNGQDVSVRNYTCHYRVIDVCDLRSLVDFMRDMEVEAVVHLAAVVGDSACDANPTEALDINILGTASVAEASERAGIRQLVFASTCSVYGDRNDASLNPLTLYAWTKAAGEEAVRRRNGVVSTVLRLGTLYGWSPQMRYDLVANRMIKDATLRGIVTVNGGHQKRPLAHCRDASRLIAAVLDGRVQGTLDVTAFNVTIMELGKRIADILGADLQVKPMGIDKRNYGANVVFPIFGIKSENFRDAVLEIAERVGERDDSSVQRAAQ